MSDLPTGRLTAYGTYLPRLRLRRAAIDEALDRRGGGRGTRSVVAFDEDAVTMGTEAARRALRSASSATRAELTQLLFSTVSPPYLEKTNATTIHAALGLQPSVLAMDAGGAVRSAAGAIALAATSSKVTLAVCADVRRGLPGGADERDAGDAGAALLFGGSDPPIAQVVSTAAVTREFLERWRLPDEPTARAWEERFGEHLYGPLVDQAFGQLLDGAGLVASDVAHLVVTGNSPRAARSVAGSFKVPADRVVDDLTVSIGNTGGTHFGLLLAAALDHAGPDEVIVALLLADGVTAIAIRTTDALAERRSAPAVDQQVASGDDRLSYGRFVTWSGVLPTEPPRRPDPVGPAAPPSARREAFKFGLVGSRCLACGAMHLPPSRVCALCRAQDQMEPAPAADLSGTVVTFTEDHLAYSPNPPTISVVVDLDGGGRFQCELADARAGEVAIGDRVEMTFRRLITAEGIHNYFWKARRTPAVDAAQSPESEKRS